MVKEVVAIHIGQAGCQVGESTWELFCHEHCILPDGLRSEDVAPEDTDDAYQAFFSETASGQHVPRAVFVDTDPTTRDEIFASEFGRLYHPDCVLGYKQDCKFNFFEGRSMAKLFKIEEDVMDRIRMAVDLCSNLQGFFVFHAYGGGTGTGIGCEILQELRDQFDRKVIFQALIYPSHQYTSSVVEPYNAIFATHFSRDTVDLSLMFDNEASYRMCQKNLQIPTPDFLNINRLIAQCVSTCTTSLRYQCELNATLVELVTNLVPQNPYRYPIVTLSPIRHASRGQHEHFSTQEIVTDLFEERNLLADCGRYLKMNRYLAAAVLLRGTETYDESTVDLAASGQPAVCSTLKLAGTGMEQNRGPIKVSAAMAALASLVNPRGSHRKAIRFVPWLGSKGFKVGVVGVPPSVPEGFMAQTSRQGAMIGNTTAVRELFVRQYTKFLKLFFHKAYVWQYLDANGEIDIFYEAREGVRDLINSYETLLVQCVQAENEQQGEGVNRLVGQTGPPAQ